MNLDPRTIIITTIVGTLLMGFSLFGISLGHLSQIRGIRKWAGATLMQSIGWIVIGVLRGVIPELISVVLGNALLLLAIVFYFKIIAEFKNIKIKIGWPYLLVGLEAIVLTYFVVVSPDVAARFAMISACTGVMMFASSYLLLLFESGNRPFSHKLTGGMFLICGLLLTVRCFNSLFLDTAPDQVVFGPHPMQDMAYLTFYITSVMLTFGFVLMCNDKYISERKLVEDALTDSKEQINTIIINAPDGVIVIDEKSLITEWNPMSEIIFGWKKEEVIGKPLYETIIPQRFRKSHVEGINHFLKTGKGPILNKQAELTGLRKDNSEFDAGISISPTLIKGKYYYISFVTDISERKRKEFEKQEAEEKIRILSKAIEQSPVTTLITDVKGNIEFVNPKFTETSGYTLEEVTGQTPRILKTEYKSEAEYKELWNTILSGKSWHGIFQNKKKTGELYWESAVISPVKDKDGIITHFMSVKEDITERKKSEEELLISNERFLKLFNNNPVGMGITDLETLKFQFVNESFQSIFGFTKEEIVGKTSQELNIVELESREKIISMFIKQGYLKDMETIARKKNGETFWALVSVQEIILNDKKFALSSFQDITERKKTELILKNKTALLNEAQQITHIGSWDWNLIENKVTRSDEHYRIYGLSRPEPEPNYEIFQNYTHPEDREYADTIFKQAFKDCKPFDFFHRIIRPDGIVRILHAKGNVLTDGKGKAIRLVGTRQDVTEIKLAEQELLQNINERRAAEAIIVEKSVELERSNKDLEEFAYIVSHDLKAPLRAIASLSSFLKEDYGDKLGESGEELLNMMVGRADRLNNLIEGILKYSKISRGQQKTEIVNLNTIVREVKELIAPPENMEIKIENILPSVMCDPFKATQVFQNLIGNAIKYMDKPNGIIRVGSSSEDDFWKFYVADNGPGIGKKYFDKIFQIFQTLTPRDKVESTGIGLSIVKKIIESYGGKVWLESGLGKGSTFYFTMPKN